MSLFNLLNYEEAIETFDQAIKLDDKDAKIYFNKGHFHLLYD